MCKITVSKRIKDYIRSFERAVFFLYIKEVKVILYNIELSYCLYIQPISHFLLYIV